MAVVLKAAIISILGFGAVTTIMVDALDDEGIGSGWPRSPSTPVSDGSVPVPMLNNLYDPVRLVIAPGTTVTWTNLDPAAHTVTPTDASAWGSEGSGSGEEQWLPQGAAWSFTFDEPGTYTYYCIPHAGQGADGVYVGMVGDIIVARSDPAGPGAPFSSD